MPDLSTIVEETKSRFDIRVRKWRTRMSGCAWCVRYIDGRVIRWVESPYPRTPLSLSIFLHEVGHHVLGFDRPWPRCVEEHHAWKWALDEMRRVGVTPDERVRRRVEQSMQYALSKALRRGLKRIPRGLERYLPAA